MKEKFFQNVVLLSLIGVIAGSLFANIYCSDNVGEWGVFNYNFIKKMQSIELNKSKLFEYVLWERLKIWGFFLILSFSRCGIIFEKLFIIFWGFMSGMTCSTTVMEFGAKGAMYYLMLALFSQLIFQASVICAMQMGKCISNKYKLGSQSIFLIASVLFLFCSVLVEVFFNINFVKFLH